MSAETIRNCWCHDRLSQGNTKEDPPHEPLEGLELLENEAFKPWAADVDDDAPAYQSLTEDAIVDPAMAHLCVRRDEGSCDELESIPTAGEMRTASAKSEQSVEETLFGCFFDKFFGLHGLTANKTIVQHFL